MSYVTKTRIYNYVRDLEVMKDSEKSNNYRAWRKRRCRRAVKRFLRHQAPVEFPVTEKELQLLLDGSGLREVRRYRPMPLLTEAIIVVSAKRKYKESYVG